MVTLQMHWQVTGTDTDGANAADALVKTGADHRRRR